MANRVIEYDIKINTASVKSAEDDIANLGKGTDDLEKKTKKVGDGFDATAHKIKKGFRGAKDSLEALGASTEAIHGPMKAWNVIMEANPIGLIVVAIGLLIAGLVELKDSIPFVGKAFKVIGDIIHTVVQGIKDLTDWLGITDYKTKDTVEKVIGIGDRLLKHQKTYYDHKIKMLEAEGKATVNAEIEKQKAMLETMKLQEKAYEISKSKGLLSDEDLKKMTELVDKIKEANDTIEELGEKKKKEEADANEKKKKKDEEDNKKKNEDYKKYLQERNKIKDDLDKQRIENEKELENQEKTLNDIKISMDKELAKSEVKTEQDKIDQEKKDRKKAIDDKVAEALLAGNSFASVNEMARQADLKNEEIYQNARVDLQKKADDKLEKDKVKFIDDQIKAHTKLKDAQFDLATATINGLTNIAGKNKAAADAGFLIEKGVAAAKVIIDGIKERTANTAAGAEEDALSAGLSFGAERAIVKNQISRVNEATALATIAATSISHFTNSSSSSSSSGSASSGGGVGGSTNTQPFQPPAAYNVNPNGSNNKDAQPVKAIVVSQEVEHAINKNQVIKDRASF